MGASYRSALSIGLLVLLAGTVLAPTVGAQDLGQTVGDAASDAERSANEARAEAEREAANTQEHAQERALFLQEKADQQLTSTQRFVNDLLFLVDKTLHDKFPVLFSQTSTSPSETSAGFKSESASYEIVRPAITAPLMWVTASLSGLVVLLMAARKLVGLGAIPLLSRIAHSDIYNNDARRTIHELVVGEPGQCLNELVSRTGYSRNAVSYHLFVLEKEEEIVSVKDGKYRRYFTRNGKYVNGAKNVVAALRNETTLKLARVVLERPGAIQRDLCVELGATPSATCWHAKRLLDLGVIRKERVANTVQYFPGEALSKYDLSDMGLPRLPVAAAPVPGPSPAPVA